MKLTNTKANKSSKGMTLIELTVVILVLLSLISVLFIGARAWMRGSDRANAAILIRNAQQGVRSHSNILGLDTSGTSVDYAAGHLALFGTAAPRSLDQEVFGPSRFVETPADGTLPVHPDNGNTFIAGPDTLAFVPALGNPYITSMTEATFFLPPNLQ